ncbi:hypothetical protein [Streptomyces sp. NPDC056632]|uniref:hypothetical protein n=1 Tax=Streptomyces sp. NPDC056632 TaxID=3345884 RepID=UPI00369DC576
MPDRRRPQTVTNWFQAEDMAEELLHRGRALHPGLRRARAAREVLALTILLSEEVPPVRGEVSILPGRLRHRMRADEAWHNWCATRILTRRAAFGVDDEHARRAWHWLTREQIVLTDDKGENPGDTWHSPGAALTHSMWPAGLQQARMTLDAILLARVGVVDVIGTVIMVGEGAGDVPPGMLALILEVAWPPAVLLSDSGCEVPAFWAAREDNGKTVRLDPRHIISLSNLPPSQ